MPRNGHQRGGEVPLDLSAEIRELREATDGLTNRFPLASLQEMRLGKVAGPHALLRRFLFAGKRMGLRREWGERLVLWVRRQVALLWLDEQTPRPVLERLAMERECQDDLAELRLHTSAEKNRAMLMARRETLAAEIAADTCLLADLDRELERLRQ